MGARLTVCGQALYANSAEAQQIVAADGDRRWVVVDGVATGDGAHAGGTTLVATSVHVAWHDDTAIVLAPVGGGELVRIADFGMPWVTCLAADGSTVYLVRGDGDGGSVIAFVTVQPPGVQTLARSPGAIDMLACSGGWLAWGARGGRDVFAMPCSGGAPSLVYTAASAFVMCAAEPGDVLVAAGRGLVRLSLATGEVVRVGPNLAAGVPTGVAWQPDVAYIARDVAVIATRSRDGGRDVTGPIERDVPRDAGPLGRCVERVELSTGATAIVHALAPSDSARIEYLVATERGAFWIESRVEAKLVHVARDAVPVERATVRSSRPSAQGAGTAVEVTPDAVRATFGGEVTSCAQLVERIATAAPRRLELVCEAASPGTMFSAACRGRQLPVRALISASGAIGELAAILAAMPALERAFVAGTLAIEPVTHAGLRELHLACDRLDPSIATALAGSQLPQLERCALAFKRVSTAALLAVVKGLVRLAAPNLRELHLGELRGPDQIRDVVAVLAERGMPPSWSVLAFGGKLADETAWFDLLDAIQPPANLRIALAFDQLSPDLVATLQRRKKWVCDARTLGWQPCDPRGCADW